MIPLTDEENEFYEMQNTNINDENAFKLYYKVRDHCYYTEMFSGAAHSICNFGCKTSKEIPVTFHYGSTYDYHFIINQLAKKLMVNLNA